MSNQERSGLQQWMNKNDAKKCPNCSVVLERSAGCAHVECKCGVHICWSCLKTFDGEGATYEHLRLVHGGYFDADHVVRPVEDAAAVLDRAVARGAGNVNVPRMLNRPGLEDLPGPDADDAWWNAPA